MIKHTMLCCCLLLKSALRHPTNLCLQVRCRAAQECSPLLYLCRPLTTSNVSVDFWLKLLPFCYELDYKIMQANVEKRFINLYMYKKTEMGDKRNDKRNIAFNQARPDKIWQIKYDKRNIAYSDMEVVRLSYSIRFTE